MRAVTAEAELKHLRLHSCKELQEAREGLLERLEQAQATAEQRVEEHTEGYRLQVSRDSVVAASSLHCCEKVSRLRSGRRQALLC